MLVHFVCHGKHCACIAYLKHEYINIRNMDELHYYRFDLVLFHQYMHKDVNPHLLEMSLFRSFISYCCCYKIVQLYLFSAPFRLAMCSSKGYSNTQKMWMFEVWICI